MKRVLLAVLLAAATTACTVGPNYQRPPVVSPEGFRQSEAPSGASLADQAWWDLFDDPVLKALVEQALAEGYDVRLAAARVAEARAVAGIAHSEYFPAVQASASASYQRQSTFLSPIQGNTGWYDVNVGASWELDLWGRVRRLNEAALARYLSTEEARRGVQLSLVSDVAAGYFQLRALDLQLEIARRTSESFQGTHDLFRRRLDAGLASALETASAEASLATTNSRIPDLEREIAAQENFLAYLLGKNPEDIPRGAALTAQLLPPQIPAGLPSDLLERRPDLRQAEQEMIAANAEVGVAMADYFPRISLTGFLGGVAPKVSELFGDGKTWSAGGNLLTPVFQGKRLRHQKEAALARYEQAKLRYEQTVTQAFSEVATQLVAYKKLEDVERELNRSVEAYRNAVDLANSRYLAGLADYFEVLQAQRQLFPAENALTQTRLERLSTLVQLYKALGGGWRSENTTAASR